MFLRDPDIWLAFAKEACDQYAFTLQVGKPADLAIAQIQFEHCLDRLDTIMQNWPEELSIQTVRPPLDQKIDSLGIPDVFKQHLKNIVRSKNF